jgi:hypothetical protein
MTEYELVPGFVGSAEQIVGALARPHSAHAHEMRATIERPDQTGLTSSRPARTMNSVGLFSPARWRVRLNRCARRSKSGSSGVTHSWRLKPKLNSSRSPSRSCVQTACRAGPPQTTGCPRQCGKQFAGTDTRIFLGLRLTCRPTENLVSVEAAPCAAGRVGGGTCGLTPRPRLLRTTSLAA